MSEDLELSLYIYRDLTDFFFVLTGQRYAEISALHYQRDGLKSFSKTLQWSPIWIRVHPNPRSHAATKSSHGTSLINPGSSASVAVPVIFSALRHPKQPFGSVWERPWMIPSDWQWLGFTANEHPQDLNIYVWAVMECDGTESFSTAEFCSPRSLKKSADDFDGGNAKCFTAQKKCRGSL